MSEDPAVVLSRQLRDELAERAPQGFHFRDEVVRQDTGVDRLAGHLRAHPDRAEVERALAQAISDERDGWVRLKLLELVERLECVGAAPALLQLIENSSARDERARFVRGRAAEVLLKLPLDRETRRRADDSSKTPLLELQTFRTSAQRAQAELRPRRVEWLLLGGVMLLALTGVVLAFVL